MFGERALFRVDFIERRELFRVGENGNLFSRQGNQSVLSFFFVGAMFDGNDAQSVFGNDFTRDVVRFAASAAAVQVRHEKPFDGVDETPVRRVDGNRVFRRKQFQKITFVFVDDAGGFGRVQVVQIVFPCAAAQQGFTALYQDFERGISGFGEIAERENDVAHHFAKIRHIGACDLRFFLQRIVSVRQPLRPNRRGGREKQKK